MTKLEYCIGARRHLGLCVCVQKNEKNRPPAQAVIICRPNSLYIQESCTNQLCFPWALTKTGLFCKLRKEAFLFGRPSLDCTVLGHENGHARHPPPRFRRCAILPRQLPALCDDGATDGLPGETNLAGDPYKPTISCGFLSGFIPCSLVPY